MPAISRFFGIVISMFHNDHNPPHFHAEYGEYIVSININNLTVLSGYLPPRAMGLIMEWASKHKRELLKNWNLAREEKKLSPIMPLKRGG